MSLLFNINNINHMPNDLSPFISNEVDKNDIKKITKELCRSYKKGMIPEDIFHEVVEQLLAFFIERSFDDKIFSKNHDFEKKLYKVNKLSNWKK